MHVEVEIASFYPDARACASPRWLYANTQSRIHVLVTHGFLRSLARLELEESAVGRFATQGPAGEPATGNGAGPERSAGVTVGDTPWPVIGALAAGLALGLRRRAQSAA